MLNILHKPCFNKISCIFNLLKVENSKPFMKMKLSQLQMEFQMSIRQYVIVAYSSEYSFFTSCPFDVRDESTSDFQKSIQHR